MLDWSIRFLDQILAKRIATAAVDALGPDDLAAVVSPTRYEWTLIDYAIWSIGAVTVPIYETSSTSQIQWILTDS